MGASLSEYLHLMVRWAHVIAGIMWIGSSIFFNWLDSHLEEPEVKKEGVEGELWMVHSGGFYQVEKKLVAPSALPKHLHWFKWEAGFTLLTGWVLLDFVYYMGGGVLLVDPNVSSIGVPAAGALCVGTLVGSWFVYDLLWRSPLAKNTYVAATIMTAMVIGVAYGLSHVISGRAAYLHTGAMMGTWMATNVWVHIIPNQQQLVRAVKEGRTPNAEMAKRAKMRSRHNNYMTYPVVFIMISNHFPSAYGSPYNWLILAGIMIVGALVRHFMNLGDRSPAYIFAGLAAVLIVNHSALTAPPAPVQSASGTSLASAVAAPMKGGVEKVANEAGVGTIKGVVRFEGVAPPPKELTIPSTCAPAQKGPIYSDTFLVKDGKVKDVFVWIKTGLENYKGAPVPTEEHVVDQKGCIYFPHVSGVRVGQPVTFLNSDATFHNVRTVTDANAAFNEGMAGKDMRITKTFDKPEVMVRAKCDVHPWMAGFVGVVPHPFFAVSGENGEFILENVPVGDYEIEAWHELFGKKSIRVTVAPRTAAAAEFVLKL